MTIIPRGQTLERRAYMKAWNAVNPRDRRAYKSAYDASHREASAAYRASNREVLCAQKRAYYQQHRERVKAAVQLRAKANPQTISRYHANHYAANAARIKANVKAYRDANPDKKAVLESRRRARKYGNGGSHTVQERHAKFAECGNVCYYCGLQRKLTADHLIPLSRGGSNDISNIVPACQPCNSKKHTLTADEYFGRTNHTKMGGVGPHEIGR